MNVLIAFLLVSSQIPFSSVNPLPIYSINFFLCTSQFVLNYFKVSFLGYFKFLSTLYHKIFASSFILYFQFLIYLNSTSHFLPNVFPASSISSFLGSYLLHSLFLHHATVSIIFLEVQKLAII